RDGSTRIEDDVQLSAVVGYIPVNPVKAGLCDRAETWPWSSHVQTVEGAGPRWLAVERLLQYLTGWGDDPRRSYVELVESRVASLR
ncbi:MAG: hypothetical protein QOI98_440, partial [Solirubrobacteraceae bacterium]|nr:hypothetical protein [Solirubrobacteraceae bacterium]